MPGTDFRPRENLLKDLVRISVAESVRDHSCAHRFRVNLYAIKTDSKGPAKSPWPMRGQNAQHTGRVMKK